MSKIATEDIDKLAELAMLEILEEEKLSLQKSIESILGYVGMVAEAKVSELQGSQAFDSIAREDDLANVVPHNAGMLRANIRQLSSEGFVEVSKVINK
jgi:aspartyl/glutamyl-tRNA(Asn/Gln) amidotransferase C subunit